MQRRPEPELMDTAEQAIAYARADFRDSNNLFIRLLEQHWPDSGAAKRNGCTAIDLGCGPADIVLRFLRAWPQAHCTAVDGSAAMLAEAQHLLDATPELQPRAQLVQATLPDPSLGQQCFDLILSNSLLHHLHQPEGLWHSVRQLGRPGAFVLIMDLLRPPEPSWVEALVKTYAAGEPEVLCNDFRHSLRAAFEPAEVQAQLRAAELDGALDVHVVSDRHLAVWGQLPA
ncbi:class I SAM-dependent methyltransferase [Rhabdochromatium marinum]|uniref:class I SAM-dependent methyltransferase n=1 Tax=Rhabdochromatium marinum TaxID=48729 RepID=UPI001906C692|nr:class I SAM-dependent methyltransferase [Rhabdochromatium marinum]MBK1648067.1 SAM-dependent methyltransferase [Rhabdochromatium marinum]